MENNKFKLILCLALVLSGCAANKPACPIPQAAFSAGPGIYIVQPGDSEAAIAKKLCLSMEQLSEFNPGINWSRLKIGKKLKYVGLLESPVTITYYNGKYDFTFLLPENWQGYSILTDKWDASLYKTNDSSGEIVGTESGPIIVLRNPLWKTNDLYQDIPIMAFTHKQWDEENQGRFFPYAGGFISEMWHNSTYVFGLYSRYNAYDDVKGWEEADDIIATNCAFHTGATLYPKP